MGPQYQGPVVAPPALWPPPLPGYAPLPSKPLPPGGPPAPPSEPVEEPRGAAPPPPPATTRGKSSAPAGVRLYSALAPPPLNKYRVVRLSCPAGCVYKRGYTLGENFECFKGRTSVILGV